MTSEKRLDPTPEQENPSTEILDAYFHGTLSSHEEEKFVEWVSKSEKRRISVALLGAELNRVDIPGYSSEEKEDRIESIVGAALGGNSVSRKSETPRSFVPRSLERWIGGIAAGGLAVLLISWFARINPIDHKAHEQYSVYTTNKGERATITLPDGSSVHLNVATRLEVPADYAFGNRTIKIEGEAFFTVVQNSSAVFTVISERSKTRVLGTRFAVREYATDSTAVISVREGKVSVGSSILTANQKIEVSDTKSSQVSFADSDNFVFVDGILAFNNMPLDNAINTLGRWYDAEIQIGDSKISKIVIGGKFGAGSISDLIEYLEWTFNLRVVRNGRYLTLYPKS